jgi:maltose alpha-D-glucosyltransferase/alpha-amylase
MWTAVLAHGAKIDGQLVNLLSDDHSTPNASGKHSVMLEPYGYRWFRIGGLDYLLKRTET